MRNEIKRIVFLTGTRADFGKLKALISILQKDENFEVHLFVTGMHMLSKYGSTWKEVEKLGCKNVYKFINQNYTDTMDHVLGKTVTGLADYVKEIMPNMLIVHGDRVEALAGAIVGSLNNILVSHIEGGEVSGTIDDLIRHSVSKLSHIHFVANDESKKRLVQLGERNESIYVVGSPDIDVMSSTSLPSIKEVKDHYQIPFRDFNILMFHPVTTEVTRLRDDVKIIVNSVMASGDNFVVIYPNNDHGTEIILNEYARFQGSPKVKVFPSMRFESFLTLLKNADYVLGNSSAGVREAPHFGVPSINIGSRQNNRVLKQPNIINCDVNEKEIKDAMLKTKTMKPIPVHLFGQGNSASLFYNQIKSKSLWGTKIQKSFIDLKVL